MTTEIDRRRLLRQGSLMAPFLALGALGGTAASASEPPAATGATHRSLIGAWAIRVTFTEDPVPPEVGLFAFTSDQLFYGTTSRSDTLGVGSWRTTRQGFGYAFRHLMHDADGTWIGEVRAVQEGRMTSADTWSASGTGTVLDTEGREIAVRRTATAGTRY
ncbi:MAG: hypothetical protein AVDCRST_MAG66-4879 [uncultured Pseudonocardia sp.]|uniref:Lipocalin-like domain-containing protein n=1 Tax=uncultured Pseudonocardia sp. TaxID=211455 RepID=A0A6J4QL98_9PSEU|nr:MAG: hypothetical protein AVDCRST_MAG66-4879 [uncultured Pseudonocardia sp.]